MQKDTASLQIYSWLAWSLLIGYGVALVLLLPVSMMHGRMSFTIVEYLQNYRYEDVSGRGLSDYQWLVFLLTTFIALYRIAQGEIQQDGRGWLLCFSGIVLFGMALRLGDVPRLACLGLPMMLYGATRFVFGPVAKSMFLPCLILLLTIPLRQINWLEECFFDSVKTVLSWIWGKIKLHHSYFFLCDDLYYLTILRDTLTSLLLLFFLCRMSNSKRVIITLLALIWSYTAAVALYATEYSMVCHFPDMPMNSLENKLASTFR
jgi:hypothetical protein